MRLQTPPICSGMGASSKVIVWGAAGFGQDGGNDCITVDEYKNYSIN